MSRWFRFYEETLDDPKVQKLDGETFKGWVNLLALASRNGGKLPAMPDIAFALRITEDGARTLVERLLNGGLIDRTSGGVDGYTYAPHSWDKRQYKSDTSTDRVKRYRQRSKTVTETPPETDSETEYSVSKDTGSIVDPDKLFWDMATGYLGPKSRGMIGKWIKDYTRPRVAEAIAAAQVERAVDPIAYIAATLRRKGRHGAGDEMTMPC
jgi:hypothetical protein